MHTVRIPADPAPAAIAATLAMHAGHIDTSCRYDRVDSGHVHILMQVSNGQGVTSVAGFRGACGPSKITSTRKNQPTDPLSLFLARYGDRPPFLEKYPFGGVIVAILFPSTFGIETELLNGVRAALRHLT